MATLNLPKWIFLKDYHAVGVMGNQGSGGMVGGSNIPMETLVGPLRVEKDFKKGDIVSGEVVNNGGALGAAGYVNIKDNGNVYPIQTYSDLGNFEPIIQQYADSAGNRFLSRINTNLPSIKPYAFYGTMGAFTGAMFGGITGKGAVKYGLIGAGSSLALVFIGIMIHDKFYMPKGGALVNNNVVPDVSTFTTALQNFQALSEQIVKKFGGTNKPLTPEMQNTLTTTFNALSDQEKTIAIDYLNAFSATIQKSLASGGTFDSFANESALAIQSLNNKYTSDKLTAVLEKLHLN